MSLFRLFRRNVTPPEKKQKLEADDKALIERLRRQLAAERRVMMSDGQ